MLSSKVLVLNRSYLPVHITTVRRAVVMLYQGYAKVLGDEYQVFDFKSWLQQRVEEHHDTIGLVDRPIRIPRILLLSLYDRVPLRHVRFSRQNIYLRDRYTCQYCAVSYPRLELNLDHVVPRSRGGKSNWENVVCCCLSCNHRKGGNLPHEVGMALMRPPVKPQWVPVTTLAETFHQYQEWHPFLKMIPA